MPEPEVNQKPDIGQVVQYVNKATGQQITVLRSVNLFNDPDWKPTPDVMRGMVVIDGPQGRGQLGFQFPLDKNLAECFENFDKLAHEAIMKAQQEEKSKIIVPGQGFPKR